MMGLDWESIKQNVITEFFVGIIYGTLSAVFLKVYKRFFLRAGKDKNEKS